MGAPGVKLDLLEGFDGIERAALWLRDYPDIGKPAEEWPEIYDRVISQRLTGWEVFLNDFPVALVLTGVEKFASHNRFSVLYAMGERARYWVPRVQGDFEVVARQMGCSEIWFSGRVGWERYGRRLGYRADRITMIKDL